MEGHAPRLVAADNDLVALWRKLNFFGTAPWGARAGAEILRGLLPNASSIWEPACGNGTMSGPFAEFFPRVRASDIHDFGHGEVLNFLEEPGAEDFDIIATNPPFDQAEAFVKRALQRSRMGVAMLCRTSFLESIDRYPMLYEGEHPMTMFCSFAERLPMTLGPWSHLRWDPKANKGKGRWKRTSGATSYSWFIFLKGRDPMAPKGIRPGTRDRLWLPADVQKYGTQVDLPLFAQADE